MVTLHTKDQYIFFYTHPSRSDHHHVCSRGAPPGCK